MSRYRITESVGRHVEDVHNFRDLEKHHPSAGREDGRDYATIDGELEEIRRTTDGRVLIKKDFILSNDSGGPVNVPAPVSGYIHYLNDSTNAVRIYDRPFGQEGAKLLGQSLHMARGTSPPEGSFVQYGQPMGRMGDTGSPGSVHAHVEVESAQFKKYIGDINNGVITPETYPGRGNAGQTPTTPAPAAGALADGVLKQGEKGPEVIKLQQQLSALGFKDPQGRPLATDGDFGANTKFAVEAFQRSRGLEVDGVAGKDTFTALKQAQATPGAPTPPAQQQPGGTTPLSNLIGSGEGDYNSYNRGVAGDSRKPINLTDMTVAEIMRRQDLPRNDPDRLFAVGKFQIIPGTMEETVKSMKLDTNQKFTPALQERMFADYLIDEKRPSVKAYITGQSSGAQGLSRAQLALAQEFASVADPRTGKSFYDGDSGGNHSSITAKQVEGALNKMREQYKANIDKGMSPDAAYKALNGQTPSQSQTPTAPSTPTQGNGATRPSGAAADGLLNQGEKGADVTRVQQLLGKFGYTDANGRRLSADGDFGQRTKEAVQAFQQTHGLKADGVVGPKTFDALKKAEQAPLLSDAKHPDHALYNQALKGIEKLPANSFKNAEERQNAAAALAFEAKVSGIQRIDNVAMSTNGSGLFAVQGKLDDPAHNRVHVDRAQAATQPMEKSTAQLQQETQTQQQAQQLRNHEREHENQRKSVSIT